MEIKTSKYYNLFRILFIVILIAGLSLRFYQYLMGRSLWEDECHLALNFIRYGYKRLMLPLDAIQAAPVFWILSVKTFAKVFGYRAYALRATTFIASILTFPLFYYIILELTKSRVAALIGFFIFSVNLAVIYFSSELKPYGVDVSVYLLLAFLTLSQHKYIGKNRRLLLGIAGCLCILFSSVTFIILFCIACYMFLSWYKQKKINVGDILVLAAWAIIFTLNYFLFIYDHPSTADQRLLYSFAFCPVNIFSNEFIYFIKVRIEEIFFTMLLYISKACGFAYMLLFIFTVAIINLIVKKRYSLILFTCLPVLLHLALSALRLYPFWFRLILYLVPCFITIMAWGTFLIADFLFRKLHFVVGFTFLITCCLFFVEESISKFPLWPREIKPALNFVNKYGSGIHVYMLDPDHAYRYYSYLGYVKDSVYQDVPWTIKPGDFYGLTGKEESNYLLFYSTIYQWGYGEVLLDLKRRNLVENSLEYNGYGVMEVKPFRDTMLNSIYNYFDPAVITDNANETVAAIWGGYIASKPIFLNKGMYNINVTSRGTPAIGVFPHNNIFINGNKIGDFVSPNINHQSTFSFDQKQDTTIIIKIDMNNDTIANGEDRNTFIINIDIRK